MLYSFMTLGCGLCLDFERWNLMMCSRSACLYMLDPAFGFDWIILFADRSSRAFNDPCCLSLDQLIEAFGTIKKALDSRIGISVCVCVCV